MSGAMDEEWAENRLNDQKLLALTIGRFYNPEHVRFERVDASGNMVTLEQQMFNFRVGSVLRASIEKHAERERNWGPNPNGSWIGLDHEY